MIENRQVWDLIERLMTSVIARMRRIDELAPSFQELYEARDTRMEGMAVSDYLERFARHSQQHRRQIESARTSIGRCWPTEPSDDVDPSTGKTFAQEWYHWLLCEAVLRRAEMASELVGLTDEDLDRRPDPAHTGHSVKTIREICEHVLGAEEWKASGIEDALASHRR